MFSICLRWVMVCLIAIALAGALHGNGPRAENAGEKQEEKNTYCLITQMGGIREVTKNVVRFYVIIFCNNDLTKSLHLPVTKQEFEYLTLVQSHITAPTVGIFLSEHVKSLLTRPIYQMVIEQKESPCITKVQFKNGDANECINAVETVILALMCRYQLHMAFVPLFAKDTLFEFEILFQTPKLSV